VSLSYRPDVDGLRAVAIVPVVLFHYGVPGFSGGFTGVDVFFVISGFLITSLIVSEIEDGAFSLVRFYERRIRRIFPALFLVIAVCAAAGYFLVFPIPFEKFGRTAAAASLFVSNFVFWLESGYFDPAAGTKPLLHTWSLAVEEQFYLVFPPLVMAASRWMGRRYLALILPLLAASFGIGVWMAFASPAAGFYLLPSRLWELMLGASIASMPAPRLSEFARAALAFAGLTAIAAGVAFVPTATPVPGFAALLPCGGAAAIILAGAAGRTFATNLLSAAPVVFLGKISYSLYLWHWPVLIFARAGIARDPAPFESASLIAVSLVMSVLSWRYVEQPFRRRAILPARKPLFAAACASILAVSCVGFAIVAFKGLPRRFDAATQALLAVGGEGPPAFCGPSGPMQSEDSPPCVLGARRERYDFLLWGDSHADTLAPVLSIAASEAGRTGLFAGHDICPPLLSVWSATYSGCADMQARNDRILALIRKYDVKTVILSARWAVYAQGNFVKLEEDLKIFLNDADSREVSFAENGLVFSRALLRTVQTLRNEGRRVVIAGPWPEPGLRVPETLARARVFGASPEVGPTREEFFARQRVVFEAFERARRDWGAEIVLTHEELCAGERCKVALDGDPLYWDDDHLSRLGALRLRPLFEFIFR
jgi:peptidoglycan/LPS O-acetylase OafA/YrhL